MSKSNFKRVISNVRRSLYKHSPEILTGIGIAGMITTTVLAVKATPKAMALIEFEKDRQNKALQDEAERNGQDNCQQISKLKAIDTVKVAWKCYIPAAVTGATSIACLIGASSVHAKRNAILATAYKLSESALTEYREKVVATVGEKKEQAIRDEINKDRVNENPVSKCEIIVTGNGDTLCYDHYSKRYFQSSIEKIQMAAVKVSRQMMLESYVSLNDFYAEIGLPGTEYGDRMGWNTDKVKIVDVQHSAMIADNGKPCLVIDFECPPVYDFDRFF